MKSNWKNFILVDGDLHEYTYYKPGTREKYIESMNDWRLYEEIHGLFFDSPEPGQEGLEQWEWGPQPRDIDWTGIEDELIADEEDE